MRVSCVLTCDLGGTSLRLALIDPQGRMVAATGVTMVAAMPMPGWSEADPVLWWDRFCEAVATLAASAPEAFAGIEAIAISAMTRTQVLLDADGMPLRPAILWADSRAAATLDTLRGRLAAFHPETLEVNPFHPLARLWWLACHEPNVTRALAHVVEPKDYLNFCLTGVIASDPISMARLAACVGASSLLTAVGLADGIVPPLTDPQAAMGRVQAGLGGCLDALAGLPVLAMANDTWASVVGFGAMRPGHAYNISGTSEVVGLVGVTPVVAEGLMTVQWGEGLVQLGGPSQAGGDTLVWLLQLLGRFNGNPKDMAQALHALTEGERDPAPLLFLPYLQGERTPYWDADLRGALVGLNRRHGPPDLLRAVMEGVAFVNRIILERATAASGVAVRELRYGGGGAASETWCQIKADIIGCDVVVPEGEEHGLLGAAIVAWTMLGLFPDLATAQTALARPGRRYTPDAARRAHYDRLFASFRAAEVALRPISRDLARWGHAS